MTTAELQKQISEWTQRQAQLQGEVSALQAQLGQAALSGNGDLASLQAEYRTKTDELNTVQAGLIELRKQGPAAEVADIRERARKLQEQADEQDQRAIAIIQQSTELYRQLAEVEGPEWRSRPWSHQLAAQASTMRLNADNLLFRAAEKEREYAKQQ